MPFIKDPLTSKLPSIKESLPSKIVFFFSLDEIGPVTKEKLPTLRLWWLVGVVVVMMEVVIIFCVSVGVLTKYPQQFRLFENDCVSFYSQRFQYQYLISNKSYLFLVIMFSCFYV